MKTTLTLILSTFISLIVYCQTFEDKGITYNITSIENQEVETIGLNDKDLTILKIPNKVKYNNTSFTVTCIGEKSFKNCTKVEQVKLPNKLRTIGLSAFENCESLKTIEIPNSVTNIQKYALKNCYTLHTITIGSSLPMFSKEIIQNCYKTSNIFVSLENIFLTSLDGILYSKNKRILHIYPQGRTKRAFKIPNYVFVIGHNAFSNSKFLTVLTVGENLYSTGISCFANCPNLYLVHFNNNIKKIGTEIFISCPKLETVIFPGELTNIGDRAFADCTSLDSIVLCSNKPPEIGKDIFIGVNNNLAIYVRQECILKYSLKKDWREYKIIDCDECYNSYDRVYVKENKQASANTNKKDIPFDAPKVKYSPSDNEINVSLYRMYYDANFQLYNSAGKLVFQVNLQKRSNFIDVEKLPDGIYFYKLKYKENTPNKEAIIKIGQIRNVNY